MYFSTTIHQLPQFFKKGPLFPSIVTQSASQKFCSLPMGCFISQVPSTSCLQFQGTLPFPCLQIPQDEWDILVKPGKGGGVTSAKSQKCEHVLCLQNCKTTGLAAVWTTGEWGMRIQEPSVITSMKLLCKLPRLFWGTAGDNAREAALHTGRALGKC